MRSASPAALAGALAALVAAAACGSGSGGAAAPKVATGDNVLPASVNGSRCVGSSYVNQPCVSVTVCVPGTTTCQTVDDVLLDTGSFGLRVFRQALSITLPLADAPGGGTLAECVQYADLSADWGPVATADVVLAGEPAVEVPIQVIDAGFGSVPPSCPSPEAGPEAFNGILGVGVFAEDCGSPCPAAAGMYFASSGSSTTAVTVEASRQVQNPVARLPADNNGVVVSLPGVPAAGAPSVEGAVILGIGTRENNTPGEVTAMALDAVGEFTTTLDGGPALPGSFADTGSNGLFFAAPSAIATCGDHPQWYCPQSPVSLSATNAPSPGAGGQSARVDFQIGSFDALLRTPNAVSAQVGGGALQGAGFDWGLPFFLGRTVYLGYAGQSSSLGSGPLIAY